MGKVASEEGVSKFSFDVENISDEPQAIKIHPNCSCLLLGDSAVSIPAKKTLTFDCEFNLSGRIGEFAAKMLIEACDGHRIIPIKATIIEKWTVVPRRVLVGAGSVSSVSVSAPTADWEGIDVDSVGDGVRYRMEST